jgi:Skp family chaperone for outer membrane proteins
LKKILFLGLFLGFTTLIVAQNRVRIGFMDMDRVLENLNDYKDANAALEDKISFWKEEISNKQSKIDELQQKLDLERPLLTEELIEEREEDIAFEQEELNTYQQKRFGPQGDWLAQKVIFIQPIQNKILEAAKEIAENRKLDYVFDRSAEILVFHSEKKYDISNLVVKYINQKDKKKAREELVESRKQEQNAARQKVLEKRKREMDSIRKAKASEQK